MHDSVAHLTINNEYFGYFLAPNTYREGMENMVKNLSNQFETYLLSGDNNAEEKQLENWFGKYENSQKLYFNCSPHQKLAFIQSLQNKGKKVLMIGDGLNDAGALKQADVGLVITENTLNFTPMSDGILRADKLKDLPKYLNMSQFGMNLIKFSYVFSLMYNCIGLVFAIQGTLSPIIAAILMPINSITLVGIASLGTVWKGASTFRKTEEE